MLWTFSAHPMERVWIIEREKNGPTEIRDGKMKITLMLKHNTTRERKKNILSRESHTTCTALILPIAFIYLMHSHFIQLKQLKCV